MIKWLIGKYLRWNHNQKLCWNDRVNYEYDRLCQKYKNKEVLVEMLLATTNEPNINRIEYIGHLEHKVRNQKRELKLLNRAYKEMFDHAYKQHQELQSHNLKEK